MVQSKQFIKIQLILNYSQVQARDTKQIRNSELQRLSNVGISTLCRINNQLCSHYNFNFFFMIKIAIRSITNNNAQSNHLKT